MNDGRPVLPVITAFLSVVVFKVPAEPELFGDVESQVGFGARYLTDDGFSTIDNGQKIL